MRLLKQSHNALWQPSPPALPLKNCIFEESEPYGAEEKGKKLKIIKDRRKFFFLSPLLNTRLLSRRVRLPRMHLTPQEIHSVPVVVRYPLWNRIQPGYSKETIREVVLSTGVYSLWWPIYGGTPPERATFFWLQV